MPAMYAGTTVELCALEKFVGLDGTQSIPLCVVAIEVPDDEALFYRPTIASLPADWSDLPLPDSTQQFGRSWLRAAEHLLMLVPSVIVPEATNAVINPAHPAFAAVTLRVLRPFSFDARMFKS
jgi:RES domain-containing protein